MYLNTLIFFSTTGYTRVLLFMFLRRELAEERYKIYFSLHTVIQVKPATTHARLGLSLPS